MSAFHGIDRVKLKIWIGTGSWVLCGALAASSNDVLIADFEGSDYGGWVATGDAFGSRPARGTLGGQRGVTGFEGSGLVNSYLNKDGSTGTLTSPAFRIERPFINFLIGGGGSPGKNLPEPGGIRWHDPADGHWT